MSTEQAEKKVTYDIDKLFKDKAEIVKAKGIKVLFWGSAGTGKTYTALTFPGPIHFIDTDGGVALNLKYTGTKEVKIAEIIESAPNDLTDDKGKDVEDKYSYEALVSLEKFDAITKQLESIEGGTVVVDTITDIWSWIGTWLKVNTAAQVSKSGNEYLSRFAWGDANNRYDWIMKRLKKLNCNLVLIARSKDVYDGQGNITGKSKADAQKHSEYYVDMFVEFRKAVDPKTGKLTTNRQSFITKCRGFDLINPMIENCTYDKIQTKLEEVHGDV